MYAYIYRQSFQSLNLKASASCNKNSVHVHKNSPFHTFKSGILSSKSYPSASIPVAHFIKHAKPPLLRGPRVAPQRCIPSGLRSSVLPTCTYVARGTSGWEQ